jgi:DNA-binding CsgD family transcriptional regulator
MDLTLKPIAFDAGAAAIFKALNGRCENGMSLPVEILHTLSGLTAGDLSSFKGHFRLGKRDYACRSYLIQPRSDAFLPAMVVLHLHRDSSVSDAIMGVAFQYSLTLREQEALSKISMGLTSKEVAEQMKISPNTVKAFLRSIMLKMGVTTRAGLVGKVLEHQNQDR